MRQVPTPLVVGVDEQSMARAVATLHAGNLVALPTETVYGLGADAANVTAVKRVFQAKGRPENHPLIVHIAGAELLPKWAVDIPLGAVRLAEAFWPGPLTLILQKHPSVPTAVTGGRDTIALRVPDHPVALTLLEAFGGGVAAPSANRFGQVSPTTAEAVVEELGDTVDLVVDGGPCAIGVESTIVEFAPSDEGDVVTILRPGAVSAEAVEEVLGFTVSRTATGPSRAPGMLASHYAPRTPVETCDADAFHAAFQHLRAQHLRVGVIAQQALVCPEATCLWHADGDINRYAHGLYGWLRDADRHNLDVVLAVLPQPDGVGVAIRDRLMRAANG